MTAKTLGVILIFLCSAAVLCVAQANEGTLRLAITDSTGRAIPAAIHITSQSSQLDKTLTTDTDGTITRPTAKT